MDRRQGVWRRRGEKYTHPCVRQTNRWGGASVMVWGGILTRRKTELVVVDGNLTAQRYIDLILRPVVIPFMNTHRDITIFQQDNARPHSARTTQSFLRDHNIDILPWPPYSPDQSPIEHLWETSQLKCAISRRPSPPRNTCDLITAVHEEWDRIPQSVVRRLIDSMHRRCVACCNALGGHTRY